MCGVLTELRRYAAGVLPTVVGACDRPDVHCSVGERAILLNRGGSREMRTISRLKGALSTTHTKVSTANDSHNEHVPFCASRSVRLTRTRRERSDRIDPRCRSSGSHYILLVYTKIERTGSIQTKECGLAALSPRAGATHRPTSRPRSKRVGSSSRRDKPQPDPHVTLRAARPNPQARLALR